MSSNLDKDSLRPQSDEMALTREFDPQNPEYPEGHVTPFSKEDWTGALKILLKPGWHWAVLALIAAPIVGNVYSSMNYSCEDARVELSRAKERYNSSLQSASEVTGDWDKARKQQIHMRSAQDKMYTKCK